jgi:hypothetical protein
MAATPPAATRQWPAVQCPALQQLPSCSLRAGRLRTLRRGAPTYSTLKMKISVIGHRRDASWVSTTIRPPCRTEFGQVPGQGMMGDQRYKPPQLQVQMSSRR